jgi:hypothetical protein
VRSTDASTIGLDIAKPVFEAQGVDNEKMGRADPSARRKRIVRHWAQR